MVNNTVSINRYFRKYLLPHRTMMLENKKSRQTILYNNPSILITIILLVFVIILTVLLIV